VVIERRSAPVHPEQRSGRCRLRRVQQQRLLQSIGGNRGVPSCAHVCVDQAGKVGRHDAAHTSGLQHAMSVAEHRERFRPVQVFDEMRAEDDCRR
jgi:hypothetical protein